MSLILDGTNGVSDIDGSAATPAIRGTDTNTGIFFGSDIIGFSEGGAEVARFDSSGRLGIGTTSPSNQLDVQATTAKVGVTSTTGTNTTFYSANNTGGSFYFGLDNSAGTEFGTAYAGAVYRSGAYPITFYTNAAERMRITSSGQLLIGNTATSPATADAYGVTINSNTSGNFYQGIIQASSNGSAALLLNRGSDDGNLVQFYQAAIQEGSISVSGSTVSYNGGHLSRWSQLPDGFKDDTILKGTVMSNLDDMCVWEKDGVVAENEQLNKMKVSDVEGDTNVAGVFVNWTIDNAYGVDDMNVAMTGDMIIRIADGVVVQKGDLLMSAGDGTAMPQGDDIVRSKTIAKVTSNYVTCTYADGSYCVPCVLMAC